MPASNACVGFSQKSHSQSTGLWRIHACTWHSLPHSVSHRLVPPWKLRGKTETSTAWHHLHANCLVGSSTVSLVNLALDANKAKTLFLLLLFKLYRKYEEINAPRIEEFCFITDNTYTRDQVYYIPRLLSLSPRKKRKCALYWCANGITML